MGHYPKPAQLRNLSGSIGVTLCMVEKCYLLFVVCYLYSLTNNKEQTTLAADGMTLPSKLRKGLPAAFCEGKSDRYFQVMGAILVL